MSEKIFGFTMSNPYILKLFLIFLFKRVFIK